MRVRTHLEYDAYITDVAPVRSPRIVLLKAERMDVAGVARTYVDSIVACDEGLIAFPFIRIAADGSTVFPKRLVDTAPAICEALASPVAQWAAQKGAQAHLVADLFERHAVLQDAIDMANSALRALPGASPHEVLFSEAERYACVTPYVCRRSVVDLNPGLGYGIATLRGVASQAFADLPAFSRRMYPHITQGGSGQAQVAIWLDADPARLDDIFERCAGCVVPGGAVLISVRDERAKRVLEGHGAAVTAMLRPGAGALGPLDEWLAVFHEAPEAAKTAMDAEPAAAATVHASRKLKILMALRPSAESIFGGDVVQVRQTAEALRRRGHSVELSTSPQLRTSGFDIVHLSNLTVPDETLAQAQSVADFAGPVVLMPIFIDHADETTWGMATSLAIFLQSQDEPDLCRKLEMLEQRALSVPNIEAPPKRNDIVPEYTQRQRRILESVDFVIANAHSEMHRIYRYLRCNVPYAIAPSAVDARLYGTHARARFVDEYGFADFILMPGRYEPRKNQLMLFEAVKALGYPLVCVGSNRDSAFAHAVRAYRPANAVYFSHLPEEVLAGLFAAARVVAAPSWDEVVSLTSLDAAVSEASLVLTRNSYEHEYFRDDAEYCDPASVSSIRSAIQRAWSSHEERSERRRLLAERVRREYNWDASAAATEAAYYRVLGSPRSRGQKR